MKNSKKKEEKRLAKLRHSYALVIAKYDINTSQDYKEQVHDMVMIAEQIQTNICDEADSIKIHDYEQIKNLVKISKGAYRDVVNFTARQESLKTETLDKQIDKANDQIRSEVYKQFQLQNILCGRPVGTLPDGDINCAVNKTSNTLYDEILRNSVETRKKINGVLYSEYQLIAEAAEYISQGDINYNRFKLMVDLEHYLGGYPSENSPAKSESIICKFLEAYYLTFKYNLSTFKSYLADCCDAYDNIITVVHNKNGNIKPNPMKRQNELE